MKLRDIPLALRILAIAAVFGIVAGVPLLAPGYLATAPVAERSWYWQNPAPQGNDIYGSSFIDASNGWAVGRSGTVLKTTSGGAVWQYSDAGTVADLSSVSFVDASIGWVAGSQSTVRATSDGGQTWEAQSVPGTDVDLKAISFYDEERGVAVGTGARLYYTANGGSTWTLATDPISSTSITFTGLSWSNSSTAYAVGSSGTILRSTNGGASWTQQSSGVSAALNAVSFAPGTTTGYAVGNGGSGNRWTVLKTTNGTSWTLLGTVQRVNYYGVDCADPDNVTIAGANGTIYRSTNGGSSWTNQTQAQVATVALRTVSAVSASVASIFGDYGAMLSTTDAGASWKSYTSGTSANLNSSYFIDASTGVAVGDAGTIMRTTDGGTSWDGQVSGTAALRGVWLSSNGSQGWAVGASGAIKKTADGGASWVNQTSGTTSALNAVWFVDAEEPLVGWAVGAAGAVRKTTDGGDTWSAQSSGTSSALNSVWFADENTGWAVGSGGVIRKTTNGGATWSSQSSGTSATLRSVRGVSATTAWIVGDSGVARKTTNGTSWSTLATGTTRNLHVVHFVNASRGWIGGTYGTILTSANGGTSWSAQNAGIPTSGTNVTVRSVYFTDTADGYLVGDAGTIRKSDDGGSTWVSRQFGTLQTLNGISTPDADRGWVVGNAGTVLRYSAGADGWLRQSSGTTANLRDVSMLDATRGWITGVNGLIRRTTDGGLTWNSQTSGTGDDFEAISGATADVAVAVGQDGLVRYTSNGGSTWQNPPSGSRPSQDINDVYMAGASVGWLAADNSSGRVIYKTVNGGAAWSAQPTPLAMPSGTDLYALDFAPGADPSIGWGVGENGVIVRTADGGATWQTMADGDDWGERDLFDVDFVDDTYGFATGQDGLVLVSADSGQTWTAQNSGSTYHDINAVGYADTGVAWIVGASGSILRATDDVPPVTTAALDPESPDGENGWYVTEPSLELRPNTTAVTYYSTTDASGPFAVYTGPMSIASGSTTVFFRSEDPAGNMEPVQSIDIDVDMNAPSSPSSVSAVASSATTISVTWSESADAESGVETYDIVAVPVAGGAEVTRSVEGTTTGEVGPLEPNTSYNVRVTATDAAGNVSESSPIVTATTMTLETSPLETVLTLDPAVPDGANDWYVTTPTASFASLPATVPATTAYQWTSHSGSSPATYTGTPVAAPDLGLNTLEYYSRDVAGVRESETTKIASMSVDTVVPDSPQGVQTVPFSVMSTMLDLQWGAVAEVPSGIDRYDVYVKRTEDSTFMLLASTTSLSYQVLGLQPSTAYDFMMRAVSVAGNASDPSETHTQVTLAAELAPPPAVVYAASPTGDAVYVNWTPVSQADATGTVSYRVWRSVNGAPFQSVVQLPGRYNCSYVDADLTSSTTYEYAVQTIDDSGEGALSDSSNSSVDLAATTTRSPSRPSGLSAVEGSGTVLLAWPMSPNPGTTGYRVYRSDTSMGTAVALEGTVTVSAPMVVFQDSGLTNGEAYWYSVAAVDASGTGQPSVEVRAMPRLATLEAASPHSPVSAETNTCAKCHSVHTASAQSKLLFPEPSSPGAEVQALCLSCHNGDPGSDVRSVVYKDDMASRHPLPTPSTAGEMSCEDCHNADHLSADQVNPGLLDVDGHKAGNSVCYGCHSSTSALGDFSVFETSSHARLPAPASGTGIECSNCHEPHASESPHLNRYTGIMVCVQCHSPAQSSPADLDLWSRVTSSEDTSTRHPFLPEDQARGARMTCQNCHNTHTASTEFPLVDPHDPSLDGQWTEPRSNDKAFCFRCHGSAGLPVSTETTPWVEAPLATGGATEVSNLEAAYEVNMHGEGVSSTATAQLLRPDMGYQRGDELRCYSCHDPHGTVNGHALKSTVSSADGQTSFSGIAVHTMDDGGHDLRFFCNTCHIFDNASHDSRASSTAGRPVDTTVFPTDCTAAGCHTHVTHDGDPTSRL